MNRKRFAILGLGKFGTTLASELSRLGYEVLAVDQDARAVDAVRDEVTVAAVADVRDRHALGELFTAPFDGAVVAIGTNLEAAILATLFLKENGVPTIIAEAATRDRAEVLQRVGATEVVSPELEIGKRLAKRLSNPNLIEFIPLVKGYLAIEVEAPAWTAGKTLAELNLHRTMNLAVLAITHKGGEIALVPGGAAKVGAGDKLALLGRESDLERFRERK